jgi:hypothetical protein
MANVDPYAIIECVMHDTPLPSNQRRPVSAQQLQSVNFVLVLAYGSTRCKVIPRAQFCILQSHDVLSRYTQSIPIPPVADWLCCGLQTPLIDHADLVSLGIAYFSLLDNHRGKEQRVVNPAIVSSDILRYVMFYYLLRVDVNMKRLATFHVGNECDERVQFVYVRLLHYCNHLDQHNVPLELAVDAIYSTASFRKSLAAMIPLVTALVVSDCATSLNTKTLH